MDQQLPLAQLRSIRLEKAAKLASLGLDPYTATCARSHSISHIVDDYSRHEGADVTVAGRLMAMRRHGGLTFARVQDQSGSIQLLIRRDAPRTGSDAAGLSYDDLKLLDVGDFVEAGGRVGRSQTGEISVIVETLRPLTKALRPLPEKWAGVKDRELILRRRYLDMTMNPEKRAQFQAIGRMLYAIRTFLNERGFVEFLTPVIQPQYGGGVAKPFMTHVNALASNMYLAISHELYLKRLIAAGFDKVYTIGRYFRNEGIDRTHQPEFSMLETMMAYANYEDNMEVIEALFKYVARAAFGRTRFRVRGHEIDVDTAWKRVSMVEAVLEATGADFRTIRTVQEAQDVLHRFGVTEAAASVGDALIALFEARVQPALIAPTLVYGHPSEVSPLAKPMAADPRFAERFELFIAGMECSENWSEQNDPTTLLQRWTEMREGKDDVPPLDYDFIEVLEYGIPPTTGLGPGIERMAMLFTEQDNIDDVVFFPMLKPTISKDNQAIFGLEPAAEADSTPAAVATIYIDEIDPLLADGLLRPSEPKVIIKPYLRRWRKGARVWRLSGTLEVLGLMEKGMVRIAGYTAQFEERPDSPSEARRFLDVIEVSVIAPLQANYPGSVVEVSKVIWEGPLGETGNGGPP